LPSGIFRSPFSCHPEQLEMQAAGAPPSYHSNMIENILIFQK
jgi:hypothetical protein